MKIRKEGTDEVQMRRRGIFNGLLVGSIVVLLSGCTVASDIDFSDSDDDNFVFPFTAEDSHGDFGAVVGRIICVDLQA